MAAALVLVASACSASALPKLAGDPNPSISSTPTVDSVATPPEAAPETDKFVGNFTPEVLATFPHDPAAFTQGLEWHNDQLLESTGRDSSLRLVEPTTGEPTWRADIGDELFAEGVTVVAGEAVQLTYKDETLLTTDLDDLVSGLPVEQSIQREPKAYQGEGWGLCFDGSRLAMTNGSSTVTFRDPETFDEISTLDVTLDGVPVEDLNELECVNGQIWANVWKTNTILAIDPETGKVDAQVDASKLVPDGVDTDVNAVLNGIAWNPETGNFWLTGKLWPVMYEVRFVPVS